MPSRFRVKTLLLLPLLAALNGCCDQNPRDALPTTPDRECQWGVEVGIDVAVWECIDQKHVVAYRRSTALFGCSAVQVQQAPCGELTPIEQEYDGDICGEGSSPVPY